MKKEIEGIIDISEKKLVKRVATATGQLKLSKPSIDAINANKVKKGNVIEASTIAAIQAVKETPRIIPHCHPIPLEGCNVDWEISDTVLHCTVTVTANYKTGIEMEAITGVCAGLLLKIFAWMNFVANINSGILKRIEDWGPTLGQLVKGCLDKSCRSLWPWIHVGPRQCS